MIGAVHVHPAFSLTFAAALAAFVVWYWARLGRPHVPAGRRWVRRISMCFMLLGLPALVRGLSFVDPAVDKRAYLIAWTMTFIIVLVVLLTAFVDVIVSLRVHRAQEVEELKQVSQQLRKAILEHDRQAKGEEKRGDESQ